MTMSGSSTVTPPSSSPTSQHESSRQGQEAFHGNTARRTVSHCTSGRHRGWDGLIQGGGNRLWQEQGTSPPGGATPQTCSERRTVCWHENAGFGPQSEVHLSRLTVPCEA